MGYMCCNAESAIATCHPYNKPAAIKIRNFTYSQLESATNHFSPANFLGKGSHGTVYKAVLDNGNLTVAVKKTTKLLLNNRNAVKCVNTPAENEIEILSKLRSRNLVNLIGFSSDDSVLLLVVEFMPNGSLFDLLHSNPRPPGWVRRVRFALNVAKAVWFLHTSDPPVIHRDIKSSNVLIDSNGRARIGDFGLALRGHVAADTPPAGTLGYLDPSYLAPGDLTTKSDVFSFGILLLEIITGRHAIDLNFSPPSVVDWAVPIIARADFHRICDRRIASPEDFSVIRQLALLAAKCVRSVAGKRPAMSEVVESLRIADKRIRSPIWNNFGRCMNQSGPLIRSSSDLFDEETRKKKVSSVTINVALDHRDSIIGTGVSKRVGRSKSIGSSFADYYYDEIIKPGSVRRKHDVAVKMPVVRLSKSRSMGMLNNSKGEKGGGGVVLVQLKNPQIEESEECKLLVSLDQDFKAEEPI